MENMLEKVNEIETAVSKTFDVYNNIRDLLNTLWISDGARPLSKITFDDWNRMNGALVGIIRLFQVADAEQEKAYKAIQDYYDAEIVEDHAAENGSGNIINLQSE